MVCSNADRSTAPFKLGRRSSISPINPALATSSFQVDAWPSDVAPINKSA